MRVLVQQKKDDDGSDEVEIFAPPPPPKSLPVTSDPKAEAPPGKQALPNGDVSHELASKAAPEDFSSKKTPVSMAAPEAEAQDAPEQMDFDDGSFQPASQGEHQDWLDEPCPFVSVCIFH